MCGDREYVGNLYTFYFTVNLKLLQKVVKKKKLN